MAVAKEIKHRDPSARVCYIGVRGDKLQDVADAQGVFDDVWAIRAGKFRRYHQEGWRQIFDLSTVGKNLRDFWYVIVGSWQSYWLLRNSRPAVVFIKGGYVGVPVGLAAALRRIPLVTHDSDALPGLANRIVSRWAVAHAVALPKTFYTYPPDKVVETGVPVDELYQYVTPKLQAMYQRELRLKRGPVVCISGGGLGAQRINEAITAVLDELFARYSEVNVLHLAGRDHQNEIRRRYQQALSASQYARCRIEGFVTDAYRYSGAADVVVCRAGATSLAELAMQAKACVVIPNPLLTGGHQLKNAQALEKRKAAIILPEDKVAADPSVLLETISSLLGSQKKRHTYGEALHDFTKKDATKQLAGLIITTGKGHAISREP